MQLPQLASRRVPLHRGTNRLVARQSLRMLARVGLDEPQRALWVGQPERVDLQHELVALWRYAHRLGGPGGQRGAPGIGDVIHLFIGPLLLFDDGMRDKSSLFQPRQFGIDLAAARMPEEADWLLHLTNQVVAGGRRPREQSEQGVCERYHRLPLHVWLDEAQSQCYSPYYISILIYDNDDTAWSASYDSRRDAWRARG